MSKPTIGNHVYIQGTGQWYAGQSFGAAVVDVRDSDDTVKVRFTDGGYKRFKTAEFNALVTQSVYTGEMPEEWSVQRSSSQAVGDERTAEMKQLHDDIMDSVKKGDFLKADEYQKKFKELSTAYDEIQAWEIKLLDSVNKGDFKSAHEIQTKLKDLKGGKATTPAQVQASESGKPKQSVLQIAASKALSGGIAGMSAMVLQVSTLMWMRT